MSDDPGTIVLYGKPLSECDDPEKLRGYIAELWAILDRLEREFEHEHDDLAAILSERRTVLNHDGAELMERP